jgi:hypothetical protein
MFARTVRLIRRHAIGWGALVLGGSLLAIVVSVLGRPRLRGLDHLLAEATSRGWVVEVPRRKTGLFSSALLDARVSHPQYPGLTAEISKIEAHRWPWGRQPITVAGVRAHLAGDPAPVVRAIATLAGLGNEVTVSDVHAVYAHRAVGSVDLSGLTGHFGGAALLVEAATVRMGPHAWQSVKLAVEPRGETAVITPGDDVANARVQLSCFPSSGGASRWLLDLSHQPARPLANRAGWDLGPAFDATQVAGSLSLDIPDAPGDAVRGRLQLVLDRLPSGTPPEAESIMGETMALLSNVVPSPEGAGWDLPRVELTNLAFKLVGKGHVDLGAKAGLTLAADGRRTCRQLRSLVPPSTERERVAGYLAAHDGTAASAENDEIRLWLQWNSTSGAATFPVWSLEDGCGLAGWTTAAPSGH